MAKRQGQQIGPTGERQFCYVYTYLSTVDKFKVVFMSIPPVNILRREESMQQLTYNHK